MKSPGALSVAPSSVTHMLKKLDENGYIKYSPYQGAVLTNTGLKSGEKITRKHRLLERFLYDILKMGKDKVHDQACEMEHTLNDEAERALCRTLKHPDKCPDDQKLIPPCDLQFSSCEECQKWGGESIERVGKRQNSLLEISNLKEHEAGRVAFIRGDNKHLRATVRPGFDAGCKGKSHTYYLSQSPSRNHSRGLQDYPGQGYCL